MKFTAEDFANSLAGGMDKHKAVADIKHTLMVVMEYKCKITRRKTATGEKIYFVIEPANEDREYPSPWWKETETYIRTWFPDARLTSGGSMGWTIAEY